MGNQFEKRTGLQGATAGEGLNSPPELLAIVSPEPTADARIRVTLGEIEYVFKPRDFVGPNDSHERGLGWDRTFEWGQQSEAARLDLESQILGFLHGAHPKPIECEHAKGKAFATVINGRHTVLAARIANLIRVRLKKEPANVGFRRRIYDEAQAAVAADVANRHYARDPMAVIEQRLYEIEVNGWDDAAAARHFRVSTSTIRTWKLKAEGKTRKTSQTRSASGLKKAERGALFEALKKVPGLPDEALIIAELFTTGALPSDAEEKCPAAVKAWKAVQRA